MAKKAAKKTGKKTVAKKSVAKKSAAKKSAATSVKKAAKKTAKKAAKKASGRRELITPNGDARYIRRDARGRIKESDDVGRSLAADRRTKSAKKVKAGYGDQGDR